MSEVAVGPMRGIRSRVAIRSEGSHYSFRVSSSARGVVPGALSVYLYRGVTCRGVGEGVGLPSRGGPSLRDSLREPGARRVGARGNSESVGAEAVSRATEVEFLFAAVDRVVVIVVIGRGLADVRGSGGSRGGGGE